MRSYIALIHKDTGSDFGVSFPDLPGCITAGRSLDEARTFAEEALALHLAGLEEDGDTISDPSTLEAIMADRVNREAVAVVVPVNEPAPRVVRVNITLPADMLDGIDRYAERNGMTRSGFLASAAREKIAAQR